MHRTMTVSELYTHTHTANQINSLSLLLLHTHRQKGIHIHMHTHKSNNLMISIHKGDNIKQNNWPLWNARSGKYFKQNKQNNQEWSQTYFIHSYITFIKLVKFLFSFLSLPLPHIPSHQQRRGKKKPYSWNVPVILEGAMVGKQRQ